MPVRAQKAFADRLRPRSLSLCLGPCKLNSSGFSRELLRPGFVDIILLGCPALPSIVLACSVVLVWHDRIMSICWLRCSRLSNIRVDTHDVCVGVRARVKV